MFGELSKSTLTVMGCLSALAITIILFSPTKLLRWLERKRYQYEVTFSLYMMTPTEKFIFNSVLFLFLSMVTIAASLYLPEHISVITRRAFYYVAGDFDAAASVSASASLASATSSLAATATTAAEEVVETVREAVKSGVS